jgi:hypothetical protein
MALLHNLTLFGDYLAPENRYNNIRQLRWSIPAVSCITHLNIYRPFLCQGAFELNVLTSLFPSLTHIAWSELELVFDNYHLNSRSLREFFSPLRDATPGIQILVFRVIALEDHRAGNDIPKLLEKALKMIEPTVSSDFGRAVILFDGEDLTYDTRDNGNDIWKRAREKLALTNRGNC